MVNPEVLSKIGISQSGCFYYWHVYALPILAREIACHSANRHLVPVNPEVAKRLVGMDPDEDVQFKGYLLQVQADHGSHWQSSTSRDDTGGGACALALVDAIEGL